MIDRDKVQEELDHLSYQLEKINEVSLIIAFTYSTYAEQLREITVRMANRISNLEMIIKE